MTPFTVLHRLGDACLPRLLNLRPYWADRFTIQLTTSSRLPIIVSSGVNTLAGRSGWFNIIDEATSDLWAKYLLTGKIAYDPEALPLDGSSWFEEELLARRHYSRYLKELFPQKLIELRESGGMFDI